MIGQIDSFLENFEYVRNDKRCRLKKMVIIYTPYSTDIVTEQLSFSTFKPIDRKYKSIIRTVLFDIHHLSKL